jgi:rhodanese-related sulfurtransferase
MTNRILAAALALALSHPAGAAPTVSGDGACGIRATDNESFLTCDGERAPAPASPGDAPAAPAAAIEVTADQAWRIKRDLGSRVLLVDIGPPGEAARPARPSGVDANVPFTGPAKGPAEGEFPAAPSAGRFLAAMDEQLAGAGLGFGDPVILLCRTGACSVLAAQRLVEHGYAQVFAVSDGFEGWAVASGYGRAERP